MDHSVGTKNESYRHGTLSHFFWQHSRPLSRYLFSRERGPTINTTTLGLAALKIVLKLASSDAGRLAQAGIKNIALFQALTEEAKLMTDTDANQSPTAGKITVPPRSGDTVNRPDAGSEHPGSPAE